MSTANWYYTQNGQSMGPVTAEVITTMLMQGTLKPQDLVWRDGMSQWAAISSIPELAGAAPAPMSYASPQQGPYAQQNLYAPQGPYAQAPGYGQPGYQGSLNYYAPTQHANYAGFWKRFAAAFIDGILLNIVGYAISAPIILAAGGNVEDIFGINSSRSQPDLGVALAQLASSLIQLVIGWLYYAMMESSAKQGTLGKQALGIIVTDEFGQRISFGRATGRYFAKILSGCTCLVGYIMAAFTERKQAMHDMICKTLVVNR